MNPSKGEIWLVNLDPTLGDEIRKMRPAIVRSVSTRRFVRSLGRLSDTDIERVKRGLKSVFEV
jgi:mRNA-degrading endonuclease toxin of MazEF toxin-antitoxin module